MQQIGWRSGHLEDGIHPLASPSSPRLPPMLSIITNRCTNRMVMNLRPLPLERSEMIVKEVESIRFWSHRLAMSRMDGWRKRHYNHWLMVVNNIDTT
jgi:hypothetical protein